MSSCKHEQHYALSTYHVSGSGRDETETVKERDRPCHHRAGRDAKSNQESNIREGNFLEEGKIAVAQMHYQLSANEGRSQGWFDPGTA